MLGGSFWGTCPSVHLAAGLVQRGEERFRDKCSLGIILLEHPLKAVPVTELKRLKLLICPNFNQMCLVTKSLDIWTDLLCFVLVLASEH